MANLAFKRAVADMSASNNRGQRNNAFNATPAGNNNQDGDTFATSATTPSSAAVVRRGAARSTAAAGSQIDDDCLESKDRIPLSAEVSVVRMHQLAITLRPLTGGPSNSGGRARASLTASRWEVRKAIMSLCCTPPTMFEVNTTCQSNLQYCLYS